jgi:hypothetical protein
MLVPHLLADAAVAVEPAVGYGMTSARLEASITALVGLAGIVAGGLALRSTGRTRFGRRTPIVALLAGLISMVLGVVLSATAKGGPGTGNGIVGAWLAVVFGLISMMLGGLALARSRRTSHDAGSIPTS